MVVFPIPILIHRGLGAQIPGMQMVMTKENFMQMNDKILLNGGSAPVQELLAAGEQAPGKNNLRLGVLAKGTINFLRIV